MAFKSGSFATFLILCRKFPSHIPPNCAEATKTSTQRAHERAPNTPLPTRTRPHSLTIPFSNLLLPGHHLLHVPLRLPNPVVDNPNPSLTL